MPSLNRCTDRYRSAGSGLRESAAARGVPVRRSVRIGIALVLFAATCVGVSLILTQSVDAHGTCANHQYRTYDGTHDGDGDGVGCESKPAPPSRAGAASVGYDRDNWSFDSSSARARLGCSSSEHVDHIVALKEAYDSGAAAWSSTRKAEFGNDPANLWCLDASVNLSKSDGDLAEWAGGSCAQRQHIATVTQQVKRAYGLSTDGAEQRAITAALAAQCTPLTDSQSGTTESSSSGPQGGAASRVADDSSEAPAPADGANTQAASDQPEWCFSPPPLRIIALAPQLMDYCHDDSWRQLVPNS